MVLGFDIISCAPPIMPGFSTSSSSSLPSERRLAPLSSMRPYASISTMLPGKVLELQHKEGLKCSNKYAITELRHRTITIAMYL